MRNYVRAITVRSSAFVRVSQTPNGTILTPADRRPESVRARTSPWSLTGFVESGPVYKLLVAPGIVNNALPTISVSGTPTSIAANPPPSLVVTGSSGVVHLKATHDVAGTITALVIESASSLPADTSTIKYKIIGTWTASGGEFTSVVSILNTNQTFRLCNGTAEWY
jgi:hypothetical protein